MQDTVAIGTRFVEGFLFRKDSTVADEVVDENVTVVTGLSPTAPIRGLANYKQIFADFSAAFPLSALTIIDSFGTENRAVIRFQAHSIYAKDYYGVTATNRPILLDETHVMRIENGKIVENVVSATNLEFEMLLAPVLSPLILTK